jgi:L-ribulose-5-phosphate 3-epimerase
MNIRRRDFLKETALGAALALVLGRRAAGEALGDKPSKRPAFQIGGCDWSLGKEGDPESFAVAKAAGLEGVEVSCGKGAEQLPIVDLARQLGFLTAAKQHRLAIPSTCLEILHRDGLKDHRDAVKWVEQAIEPSRALGAKVILLPFFGKQAINQRSEQQAVADRLKRIAPQAEEAGVVLGLENTISAEDNAWILERVGSPAVKVYYDCGNSFQNKFDIYAEVAWLGKDRICQIHLKDRTPLGKGEIDFPRFLEGVLKSGFTGWLMLETRVFKTAEEDFAENAAFIRGLLKKGA